MANIMVLGGTKFFGITMVEKLLAEGHDVTVISRVKELPESLKGKVSHISEDIGFQEGETADQRTSRLAKLIQAKKVDIVIDNVSWLAGEVEGFIKALSIAGKSISQYVLCSSVAAYNDWNKQKTQNSHEIVLLKEDEVDLTKTGYNPDVFSPAFGGFYKMYAEGKRKAEQELVTSSKQFNFPYTIMRPAVIEGSNDPHNRTWYWIQRLLDGGEILIPDSDTKTFYKHVYAEDVAQAFCNATGNKSAYNEIFNIAGNDTLSVEEYIYKLAELLNISKENVRLVKINPKEAASKISGFEFPPFFSEVAFITNIEKAAKHLNFQPQAFQKWMGEIVKKIGARKNQLPLSLGYDKRAEEITLAKSIGMTKNSSSVSSAEIVAKIHERERKVEDTGKQAHGVKVTITTTDPRTSSFGYNS
jgi:nucleoside-diphosphate-sugar epimerase